jgi:anti-sigma regulatory factor (Ser/Thr protein kinase)
LTGYAELRNRWDTVLAKESRLACCLDMSLTNDVQEVARVIDGLEEIGALRGNAIEQSFRFSLALDELITNIIWHGFAGRKVSMIQLLVEHEDGTLSAEFIDDGPPFDPLLTEADEPSRGLLGRSIGGLGLRLVKASMDRARYQRNDRFNQVNMLM